MSLATVQDWVRRAADRRLDRVAWIDRPHGGGARGPGLGHATRGGRGQRPGSLRRRGSPPGPPRVGTPRCPRDPALGRLLLRRGDRDARRRVRRPAPPRRWDLADGAVRQADLDSFDVVSLRRTDPRDRVDVPGPRCEVGAPRVNRLVRIEVDLAHGKLRLHALRRREPSRRPLRKGIDHTDAEPSLQRVAGMSRHLPAFDQTGDRAVVALGPCSSRSEKTKWPG